MSTQNHESLLAERLKKSSEIIHNVHEANFSMLNTGFPVQGTPSGLIPVGAWFEFEAPGQGWVRAQVLQYWNRTDWEHLTVAWAPGNELALFPEGCLVVVPAGDMRGVAKAS